MVHQRFRDTGRDSFFGYFVYDQVVPQDHFLRQLNDLVDWEGISRKLARYYEGGASYGPSPYEPAMLLKMLLVSYLYNLSERQVEELANDTLSVKFFLGLAVNEKAPDHSTLTVFKHRLLAGGGVGVYEELFQGIVGLAKEKGIEFGTVQVVDSTHTEADVDVKGEDRRRKGGGDPRDRDAQWGVKGSRVEVEGGKKVKKPRYFYGYKQHVSLSAHTGLITAVTHTPGNAPDGKYLPVLVERDERAGVETQTYAADRGYDDGENHLFLWDRGLKSAISLNRYRTEKKDGNKGIWHELKADPDYQLGLRERYKVERKFGEGKRWHGLGRCRYVGLAKFALQGYITAIVLNLKRMVKLLWGVSFRNQAYGVVKAG
jgi:IS5 family transposase